MRLVWTTNPSKNGQRVRELPWFVTNYEFLRPIKKDNTRRDELIEHLRPFNKIFLVLDESSAIKERTSKQAKAVAELRRLCGFPDDYVLLGSYAQRWGSLGNAVPPPMAFHVGRALAEGVLLA